jgi:hypothetical protein
LRANTERGRDGSYLYTFASTASSHCWAVVRVPLLDSGPAGTGTTLPTYAGSGLIIAVVDRAVLDTAAWLQRCAKRAAQKQDDGGGHWPGLCMATSEAVVLTVSTLLIHHAATCCIRRPGGRVNGERVVGLTEREGPAERVVGLGSRANTERGRERERGRESGSSSAVEVVFAHIAERHSFKGQTERQKGVINAVW